MFRALTQFMGYDNLTERQLKRVRHRHMLYHAFRGRDAIRLADLDAVEVVQRHLENGQAAQYGIKNAHINARLIATRFISRRRIAAATRLLDPQGVEARDKARTRIQRIRYTVKGPNRVWSVDGHDKLSRFGFEIYGIIDGYSRYITRCYVGVSNRTQVAVQKIYLLAVAEHGFPKSYTV